MYFLLWTASDRNSQKTYKTAFMIVLKLLKAGGGEISVSSEGSRPKFTAEITIKLANSYRGERAAVQQLLWV